MNRASEKERVYFHKNFYNRLREVMEKHEVTINELVTEAHCPPCFIETLIKGEGQSPTISAITLLRICKCCNCSSDYLLGLSDNIN